MDLNFKYTKRIKPQQLEKFLQNEPCIVYVYSPSCGACMARFSHFDVAVRGLPKDIKKRVCCYNAILPDADSTFTKLSGVPIEAYPTIFGFSTKGRVVEYNGSETTDKLKTFLEALKKT